MKPLKRNQFYISQNSLKVTYSNMEFQKFSWGDTPDPATRAGEGDEGKGKEKGRKRFGEVGGRGRGLSWIAQSKNVKNSH